MSRRRDIAAALAALAALLALVVGVPAALIATVGSPLPTVWPSWTTFSHAVQTGGISDHTILKAVAVVVWAAWLQVTLAAVAEISSILRRRATATPVALPGIQLLVGQLIATVLLLTVTHPRPQSVSLQLAAAPAPATSTPAAAAERTTAVTAPSPTAREWIVHPRESLWGIAEQTLGDGRRFNEIAELNRGRRQPDGVSLESPHLIRPGWILQLPEDARVEATPPDGHRVVPGDTLSVIAQARLGDAGRWHELWELNRDRRQPDGHTLQDPNLLRPGWIIQLPNAPASLVTPVPTPAPAPTLPAPTLPAPTLPAPTLPAVGSSDGADAHAQDVTVVSSNDSSPIPEDAALGAGGLTLAGLVIVLERRRRAGLRRRSPGQPAPTPAPALQRQERALIAAADVDRLTRVDLALRAAANGSEGVFPRLLHVEATSDAVLVHLDRDAPAPPGFTADGRARWRTAATTAELRAYAGDALNPAPTLVPIGTSGDDTDLLVNLEAFGTVALTGPPDLVASALRAVALAATTAPWAQDTAIVTTRGDLGAAIPTAAVPETLPRQLAAHLDAVDAALRDAGVTTTAAARAAGHTPDAWTPLLVITDQPLDDRVPGDHGCAVVTTATDAATDDIWRLHLDGTLDIPTVDGPVRAALLDPDTTTTVADLLQPPAEDHAELLEPLPPHGITTLDLRDTLTVAALRDDIDVLIRVLGDVEAVRVTADSDTPLTIGRQKTLEAITYLACRDSAVLIEDVQHALWPDGSHSAKTLQNVITDARTTLAEGRDGPLLPPASGGRYHLSDRVATDYDLFHELVERAGEHDNDEDPASVDALLADALTLVRGEPFVGVGRSYAWVTHQRGVLVSEIIDAAEALAVLRLRHGDWRGAEWAARQGLRAFPCDERLYRVLMRAAAAAGNTAAVQRIFDELCAVVADPDLGVEPEDSIHPETVGLLDALTSTPRLRAAAP